MKFVLPNFATKSSAMSFLKSKITYRALQVSSMFRANFADSAQCEGILFTMSDLSLADFLYGPKFNLNCKVLVEKQNYSIAYKKASNIYILFFR